METDKNNHTHTFERNGCATSSNGSTSSTHSYLNGCRRKLQYKMTQSTDTTDENQSTNSSDRNILSIINLNETRRLLRNGAEKLSRTYNTVRTSLGNFSQKFRMSTKRRQILEEGPMTPNCITPHTFTRQLLGRTPTKLYSPFGIDSPYHPTTYNKENMPVPERQICYIKE